MSEMESSSRNLHSRMTNSQTAFAQTPINVSDDQVEQAIASVLWKPEDTAFGTVFKGPNGEVLLPPGMFNDIENKILSIESSKWML